MTLSEFKKISAAIAADVDAAFKKHGLNMVKRSASVDEHNGVVRYSITLHDANLKDASGNATTPEEKRFGEAASYVGLNPSDLHKVFSSGGKAYEVVGMRDGRTTRPILVKRVDNGKSYVFSAEDVRAHLAAAEMKKVGAKATA